MKLFSRWLVEKDFVVSEDVIFNKKVSPKMPYFIASWIMDK
jgi:hypothetical protein